MSEITLEVLAAEVAEIKTKVNEIYTSSPVQQAIIQANQQKLQNEQMAEQKEQQKIQQLQQERQMITQLQMEGYTKEEAIIYYSRMLKGEKPWLDPPGTPITGTPINFIYTHPEPSEQNETEELVREIETLANS